MNIKEFLEIASGLFSDAWKLLETKNKDYSKGDAFGLFDKVAQIAKILNLDPSKREHLALLDILSKVIRLRNLENKNVEHESVRDSCVDGINFFVLYYGMRKREEQQVEVDRRYIFIDGGSHKGESIKWFERSKIFNKYPWEIFAFEPHPDLVKAIPKKPYLTVFKKAIWTHDHGVGLYRDTKEENDASSILHLKNRKRLYNHPISVWSVNFSQWLVENFDMGDYILIKLDIEGAEYKVLHRMLYDGTVDYVNGFFVEFHNTMVGVPTQEDTELITKFKSLRIPFWVLGRFSTLLKEVKIDD